MSHTKPFEYSFLLDKATSLITRFSVPVFFTLTGYFLFSGSFTAAKLKKYLLHTVRFFLIWTVITLIFELGTVTALTSAKEALSFFCHCFLHGIGPLWFLPALILGSLIVGLGLLKGLEKPLYVLAAVMLFILLLFNSYNFILIKIGLGRLTELIPPIRIYQSLFYSVPYLMLGHFCNSGKPVIKRTDPLVT